MYMYISMFRNLKTFSQLQSQYSIYQGKAFKKLALKN